MGSLNAIMVYKLCLKMLRNTFFAQSSESEENRALLDNSERVKQKQEMVAQGAAYVYVFSQVLVYQISAYSETLFTFL